MKEVEQLPEPECCVCGETISVDEGNTLEVSEAPHTLIEHIRGEEPGLADALERNDGVLVHHAECSSPLDKYLSVPEDILRETEEKYNLDEDSTNECSVCGLLLSVAREECPRCGSTEWE